MTSFERKKSIPDGSRRDGRVSINTLAEALGVTQGTIRADLDSLEQRGLLLRTHGGAVVPEHSHLARHVRSTLQELSASETIELLVAGGALRKPDLALIGGLSQHFFERLHPDLMFLGANGFCVEKGVSCANLIEAETKRFMIKSANRVCLLADSSKSGRAALAHVCGWEEIDVLVTDNLGQEEREALSGLGVEVMTPQRG